MKKTDLLNTKSCPFCDHRWADHCDQIMIEISYVYDGVFIVKCIKCFKMFRRFSGKEIKSFQLAEILRFHDYPLEKINFAIKQIRLIDQPGLFIFPFIF